MAVRPVLQLGNPLLRQKAAPVNDPTAREIRELVRDMADTLAHWRSTTGYGRGIAAPQLGVLQRVIFLKVPGDEPWPLVNPEIIERGQSAIMLDRLQDCLRGHFDVEHSTFQLEPAGHADHEQPMHD